MNRKEYEARLLVILDHSHEILREMHVLMTDIGENAETAEWSWLYELSREQGAVTGHLYNEMYPRERRPSALTEEDWQASMADEAAEAALEIEAWNERRDA